MARWQVGEKESGPQLFISTDECPKLKNVAEFNRRLGCGHFGCTYDYDPELADEIRSRYGSKDIVVKI